MVAILGAGPIGAAVAHRLAERGRFREVRLLDDAGSAAQGKALDIRQAGPVLRVDTAVTGGADTLAAAGASVVVVADEVEHGEWRGDRATALLERLHRAGIEGPIVFAGPGQAGLMEQAVRDLKFAPDRVVGSAASTQTGAARGLVGLELDGSPVAVDLVVTGRPPQSVVCWSAATAAGVLVTDLVPAHRLLAMAQALGRLWPPGPYAIATATTPIVEALAFGSRRPHQALTMLGGELGLGRVSAMLPLNLGSGRVLGRIVPSLSPQEKTDLLKAVGT